MYDYLVVSLMGLFCYFGALALGLLFFFRIYTVILMEAEERCDHLFVWTLFGEQCVDPSFPG